ncbi:MAG: ATPase, T2SS/T4P/T4SS family [Candidatus Omnitrophota bacterium]
MSQSLSEKISAILIERGVVSEDDVKKAREVSEKKGENLTSVLAGMNLVSREYVINSLSEDLGFPTLNLSRVHFEQDTLKVLPKKLSFLYQMLPVSRIGKFLTVAMVDPLNIVAMDDIKVITHMDIAPVIVDAEDMKEALKKCYEVHADEEINSIVEDLESLRMEMISDEMESVSETELLKITEDAPVVKLANFILSQSIKERASDILIEPMEKNCRIRYRVDGILREAHTAPRKFHNALISRIKVMSNLNIAERRLPQDGRFKLKIEDRRIDFRVSIVPSSIGEKAALRILDKGQAMIDIDRLGFKDRDKDRIRQASEQPHGMILVCGPTGCGKTTTLYSLLRHVDSPGKNLVTVEDPVEYELPGVNQVSINDDIGLTFASCLRSILRQDPDVIMVGEIRDFDTVDIAIKSALTGHLVLSTLHTNTASGSIIRLVNIGVEPFLIVSSVIMIAAQRLLRRLCPECKEQFQPSQEIADKYGIFDPNGKIPVIYRPKGCKWCNNTGYQGRVGIIECLRISSAVKKLIFSGAEDFEIEKTAKEEGMVTLRENGIENVIEGMTSLEEVLRLTV